MKVNMVTLCSGYDSQMMAMRRLMRSHPDLEVNLVAWAEIEPNAVMAHNAVFPEYKDRNLGDITKVDWSKITEPIDLLFASTPCQSLSLAGKREGMKKGTDAESALIWATEAAIKTLRPKWLLYENVKGMVTKSNMPDFNEWIETVKSYGYTVHWKVLNAEDYGIPQHRERVFIVCIRGQDMPYRYPKPIPLKECVIDRLEEGVGAKYYLPQDKVDLVVDKIDQQQLLDIATKAVEMGYVPELTQEIKDKIYGTGKEVPSAD